MNDHHSIAEHGLIGDLQTSALVSTDGTIDWFCSPRFDSPSIFASLLDRDRGGYFSARPRDPDFTTKQLYFPDTAVLITRFLTEDGVGEVIDFMPVTSHTQREEHRLLRTIRCVRGTIEFDIEVVPRFDYGRQAHTVTATDNGATFTAGDTTLTLSIIRNSNDERLARWEPTAEGDLRASLRLVEGQMRGVLVETGSEAARGQFLSQRLSSCSMTPCSFGKTGSGSPRTPADGAKSFSAQRSRSSS